MPKSDDPRDPARLLTDWELVQQDDELRTERLRVSKGWLYRTSGPRGHVALVFVPGE
jgi:hypothetical protein